MKTVFKLSKNKYIQALRFKWLTFVYDALVGITMPEEKIEQALIATANILAGTKLLDFRCGTATLTILVKQINPDAKVTGLMGMQRL